jgi:hypothetical protein
MTVKHGSSGVDATDDRMDDVLAMLVPLLDARSFVSALLELDRRVKRRQLNMKVHHRMMTVPLSHITKHVPGDGLVRLHP